MCQENTSIKTATEVVRDLAIDRERRKISEMDDDQLLDYQEYLYMQYHTYMQGSEPGLAMQASELRKLVREEVFHRLQTR